MSLDLGAVIGRVVLEDVEFQRTYVRVVRQFSSMGAEAAKGAAGTAKLDEGLAAVGASGSKAAAGLSRVEKAAAATAAAEARATAAAERQSRALADVAVVTNRVADASVKEQQAALRDLAAQERLTAAREGGSTAASQQALATARVAAAQATAIGTAEKAATSQSRFGAAMAGTLRTAGQLGLIVGVMGAIKAGIDITKEANDFQRAMVQVQTNADVTAAEVNKASGALLNMAGPVAAAPAELAVAWYHAKAVGLDYAKSIDTTRIAAEGARVGHANLEETMNALTSTVASNIPGVKNMSSAMGQLIAIVGSGDMKLADLNQALGSGILSVVKGYGLSLTDVGAALATFGDNNIRGAEAATMLRMAVQAMAVPAKAGTDTLHSLGLQTDTLAKDMQQGGLNKAILDLKAHLDASGVGAKQVGAILTEVFGKRAGPGLAVLIGQVDRLESKFKVLRDAGASFDDKWKATTQTASFALASLGHMAEAAGIQLTEKLGPAISQVAGMLGTEVPKAIAPIAKDIGSAISDVWHIIAPIAKDIGVALGGGLMVAVKAAQLLASVLAAFAGFLRDNAAVVRIVVGAFVGYKVAVLAAAAAAKVAMVAQVGLDAAMDANPIIAVTTALVALAFTYNQLGGFSGAADKISHGWEVISGQMGHLVGVTKDSNAAFEGHAHTVGNATGKITAYVSAAGHVDKVLTLATDAQKRYATMAGLVVDKNGQVAGSGDAARAAVAGVTAAFASATGTGAEFLKALDSFSTSSGTAADRAAMIGATLKAANGDALNFAAGINAAAVADKQLVTDMASAAKSVGKHGESIRSLMSSIVNLKTGTIDYNNTAAAPLIAGLQSIQTAAMGAAQAEFQHARSYTTGKNAADAAYKVYVNQTRGALLDQAAQLGITAGQAKKLADRYFGMPGKVKTLIEAEGTDPIITVLNKIGRLLAYLVGKPWNPKVTVDPTPAQQNIATIQARINAIRQGNVPGLTANSGPGRAVIAELQAQIDSLRGKTVYVNVINQTTGNLGPKANAAGSGPGGLPQGWSTVGERGWEAAYTSGGKTQIFPHEASKVMLGLPDRLPGFAGGTNDWERAIAALQAAVAAALNQGPQSIPDWQRGFTSRREDALNARVAAERANVAADQAIAKAKALAAAVTAVAHADQKTQDAAKKAADAASAAADTAKQHWVDLNNAAGEAAQKAATAATGLLAAVQAKADALASTINDFRTTVSGGIGSGVSITSLWSDTGGDATAMQARAQMLLSQAKTFVADLKRLGAAGVTPIELSQIAQLGPESGDALAKQLLALGPGQLSAISASLDAIANVAGQGAADLAQGFFGQGAASLAGLAKGIQHQFPMLRGQLQPIVDEIAAMFHFTPTVGTPHYVGSRPRGFASGVRGFSGGVALVGERGPEYVRLPRGTDVYPHGSAPRGYDDEIVRRLESIERAVLVGGPDRTAAGVLGGVRSLGQEQARAMQRLGRKQ